MSCPNLNWSMSLTLYCASKFSAFLTDAVFLVFRSRCQIQITSTKFESTCSRNWLIRRCVTKGSSTSNDQAAAVRHLSPSINAASQRIWAYRRALIRFIGQIHKVTHLYFHEWKNCGLFKNVDWRIPTVWVESYINIYLRILSIPQTDISSWM